MYIYIFIRPIYIIWHPQYPSALLIWSICLPLRGMKLGIAAHPMTRTSTVGQWSLLLRLGGCSHSKFIWSIHPMMCVFFCMHLLILHVYIYLGLSSGRCCIWMWTVLATSHLDCSSWGIPSRGTSLRNFINAAGNVCNSWVKGANLQVSRNLSSYIRDIAW